MLNAHVHVCSDAHWCANSLNPCLFMDNVFQKKVLNPIKENEQLSIVHCSHIVIVFFKY